MEENAFLNILKKNSDRLTRKERVPFYYQLKKIILNTINELKLKPGSKLPSEKEIMETFNVSRATVRKAIEELVIENKLERFSGKGTFISEPKIEVKLPQLLSFTEEIKKRGLKPSTKVISKKIEKTSYKVKEKLKTEDEKILIVERVRYADNEPIVFSVEYIPLSLNISIDEDFSKSLYSLYENKYFIKIGYAEHKINAGVATKRVSKLLDISVRFPVLLFERVLYDAEGDRILYEESICRGNKYNYNIVLQRGAKEK